MQCPVCGDVLQPGSLQVRGTFWSYLFLGLSWQDLCFDNADGSWCALAMRERRPGFRCKRCGTTVIPRLAPVGASADAQGEFFSAAHDTLCPGCGALVNPVSCAGLTVPETEPWRRICSRCGVPVTLPS
jgi:hypothetical protein